jgi:hypothetical protein
MHMRMCMIDVAVAVGVVIPSGARNFFLMLKGVPIRIER